MGGGSLEPKPLYSFANPDTHDRSALLLDKYKGRKIFIYQNSQSPTRHNAFSGNLMEQHTPLNEVTDIPLNR
jgi:hypothetical protein